jgi:hypothetical protein
MYSLEEDKMLANLTHMRSVSVLFIPRSTGRSRRLMRRRLYAVNRSRGTFL